MSHTDLPGIALNEKQRRRILQNVRKGVVRNHFNAAGINYDEWTKSFDRRADTLLAGDIEQFETGIQESLNELQTSHTGIYRERPSRLFPQHTINATLGRMERAQGLNWFVLDVFEGGPADLAGIHPGQVLHDVDGAAYAPPEMPPLKTGTTHTITLSRPDGTDTRRVSVPIPATKGTKEVPPILPPKAISSSLLSPGLGLLRITWFPGAMGLGLSKSLDSAISNLKADRLIIDLRGNIGGGLGFAHVASYLCPDKRAIGYSLTPKRSRRSYRAEEFERVVYPSSRIGFASTLARFAVRDKSIFLLTEGLGPQLFHGRVAILVNEWTNSAAEMLASFASENKLATIVGTKTGGNVLGAVNSKVGGGYWLRLPVFGWYSATGTCIEGRGVTPDITVEALADDLINGCDRQLQTALGLFIPRSAVVGSA